MHISTIIVEARHLLGESPTPSPLVTTIVRILNGAKFIHAVDRFDWRDAALDHAEGEPTPDTLARKVEDTFWKAVRDESFEVNPFFQSKEATDQMVMALQRKFQHVEVEQLGFHMEWEGGKLKMGFQVVGGGADSDNPDEGANFDHAVDDVLRRLLPGVIIEHTFVKSWTGGEHFTWKCRGAWPLDIVAIIKKVAGAQITAAARTAAHQVWR